MKNLKIPQMSLPKKKRSISFSSISQFGDSQSSLDHIDHQKIQNSNLPPKGSKFTNSSFTQTFLKEIKRNDDEKTMQQKNLKILCEKLKRKREEKSEGKENNSRSDNRHKQEKKNISRGNILGDRGKKISKKMEKLEFQNKSIGKNENLGYCQNSGFMHKRSMSTVENILRNIQNERRRDLSEEKSYSSRVEKNSKTQNPIQEENNFQRENEKSPYEKNNSQEKCQNHHLEKPWRKRKMGKGRHRRNLSSHSYVQSESFSSLKSTEPKSLKPKKHKRKTSKPDLGCFYSLKQKMNRNQKND